MTVLLEYANAPGRVSPERGWPAETTIKPLKYRPRLLVFVHPQCPCSGATIHELALVMARCQNRVDADVLFLAPSSATRDWVQSGLWRDAAAIPGVRAAADKNSVEAERFGALTSGQSLLYDARDRLLFRGGITPSRGH